MPPEVKECQIGLSTHAQDQNFIEQLHILDSVTFFFLPIIISASSHFCQQLVEYLLGAGHYPSSSQQPACFHETIIRKVRFDILLEGQAHLFTKGVTAKSSTALWAGTQEKANCPRGHRVRNSISTK